MFPGFVEIKNLVTVSDEAKMRCHCMSSLIRKDIGW